MPTPTRTQRSRRSSIGKRQVPLLPRSWRPSNPGSGRIRGNPFWLRRLPDFSFFSWSFLPEKSSLSLNAALPLLLPRLQGILPIRPPSHQARSAKSEGSSRELRPMVWRSEFSCRKPGFWESGPAWESPNGMEQSFAAGSGLIAWKKACGPGISYEPIESHFRIISVKSSSKESEPE